mgnify:CR=1 FL=1
MSLISEINSINSEALEKVDYYFEGVFTNSGVIEGSSFFQELIRRLEYKIIPRVYHDRDVRKFIFVSRIRKLLKSKTYSNLEIENVFQAVCDLNKRSGNIISRKLVKALELNLLRIKYHLNSSSFHMKNLCYPEMIFDVEKIENLLTSYKDNPSQENIDKLKEVLKMKIIKLKKSKYIGNSGVSFDLSYRYLIGEDLLVRFIKLLSFHYFLKSSHFSDELYDFFRTLKSEITKSRSVFSLVGNYWSIINYEATEYSARLGKKYASSSFRSVFSIFKSALIGGCFVGLFAFLKPLLSIQLESYSFFKYFSHAGLYSFIFLCIYFFKGVLATKQPAKIICSILNILDTKEQSDKSLGDISQLLRMSIVNQFFSVIGNILGAISCSYLLLVLFERLSFIPLSESILVNEFKSLNIWTSRSVYYACITGVWLVLSGIAGGLVDNWYREKNFHLAHRREFSSLSKKCFHFFTNHIGQIASCVFLGAALGFSPYLGHFLGLDLSIRHVTFASAQIPYILFSPLSFHVSTLTPVLLGLLGIAFFNVLVGYILTFYMLFKSRQMNSNNMKKLFFKLFFTKS